MYKPTTPHMLEVMGVVAPCMMASTVYGKGGNGIKRGVDFCICSREKGGEYRRDCG